MSKVKKPYGLFVVLLLAVTVAFASVKSYLKKDSQDLSRLNISKKVASNSVLRQTTSIKFDATMQEKNFRVGDVGTFEFWFANSGSDKLIITEVKSSCPCAKVKWPTNAIAPGKRDKIIITYDTKAAGPINKSVTVISNGSGTPIILRIKGNVSQ